MGPKTGGFRKMGVQTLDIGFATSVDVFCVKSGTRVSAVAFLKNLPPPKIAESLCAEGREIMHAQNPSP